MTFSNETQQLLLEQKEIGDSVEKLAINYKKDGTSRKTIIYLQRKMQQLKQYWSEFLENHASIMETNEVPLDHEYFTKFFKNKVEAVVSKLIADLEETAGKLYPDKNVFKDESDKPPPHADGQDKYAVSIKNMTMMLQSFNEILVDFDAKDVTLKTPEYMKETHQRLKMKWKVLTELHDKLVQNAQKYDATEFLTVEQRAKKFMPELGSFDIVSGNNTAPNAQTAAVIIDNLKLPKITIPQFDGDYGKWNQFAELFAEMIGGKNIGGVQKLMYLKQNLSGEAAKLVNHLLLTEANYEVAWDILKARYENKRLIVSALLDKIVLVESVKNETSNSVKKLHDTVAENLRALRSMQLNPEDLAGIILHHLTLKKMDDSSHQLYEQTLADSRATQSIDQLLEFLVKRFQALEAIGKKAKTTTNNKSSGEQQNHSLNGDIHQGWTKIQRKGTALNAATGQKTKRLCQCKENHPIWNCPKFLEMPTKQRFMTIKKANRCINCFKSDHTAPKCRGKKCGKCQLNHNTLLHYDKTQALFGSSTKNIGVQHVFLATAVIYVRDKNGNPIKVRALLDSGSQINILTEAMHRKLGIDSQTACLTIEGIGGAEVEAKRRSLLKIESQHSAFKTELDVFIVKKIASWQPEKEIDISSWKIPKNIQLADPNFNVPAKVDMTIGGEIFFNLISSGLISIGPNLPQLQNTVFGWIIIGKTVGIDRMAVFSGLGIKTESTLDEQVNQFWKVEERYREVQPFSHEEELCEELYEKNTTRDKTGRFIVRLQFKKEPHLVLGRSEEMATRRFLYLEKRFKRDLQLHQEYIKFMQEYEQLGHMTPINEKDIGQCNYFIPHHAVMNPQSSTTKFRVVFDASARTTSNQSLNEIMMNGPILQEDLFSIMVRFRKHEFVFSADISKMYRQIIVHPEDQKWQLIVWRNNPLEKLQYYKLNTVTYGTTCASYLAIKTLQSLADIEKDRFKLASIVAKRDFNVDDVMTGTDDIMEALRLQQELISMMKLGGMKLHKWCSNHPMLLETVPKKSQEVSLDINAEKTETKALGMKWIPRKDVFMLHYNQRDHPKITKRSILSETAQLFDPLGLVNPVIVLAKIFMQELWVKKIEWDEALPLDMQEKWKSFRNEVIKLNQVSVPRHMITPSAVNIQLHAFSDASMLAYGTAVYIRSVSDNGDVTVNLVCSKSRVAPVSTMTLPRLELCGAMIMVELVEKLKKSLNMNFDEVTYWTDSEIVLSWLHSTSSYKTFVANRIASLRRKTKLTEWRYIPTKLNPADLISRGVLPENLLNTNMWWHGPAFLKENNSEWPTLKANFVREETEERMVKTVLNSNAQMDNIIERINHRNSIETLQRVVAYCLKFRQKCNRQSENEAQTAFLHLKDLQKAMKEIVKYIQRKHMQDDYEKIISGHPEKTKYGNLSPIIDHDGIIRVGGRLEKSDLPYEQKHPALLPKNELITRLIMERIHKLNMHAGPQALLAATRQQYWPIDGKKLASSIVHQCILCVRHKPKLMQQIMGDLPHERSEAVRPFFHCGVDFAGPIMVHYSLRGKKATKAYVCLFVCFATKAVHLEAAVDMSTDGFLNCLKRFIARRGLPAKIFCDNGTNFVGAKNQLDELAKMMNDPVNQELVVKYCWNHNIEWKFIPPRSPHFGGLWEASVKSAKHHLIKILHNHSCTYEELSTILAEIESILNSRPLTPMSSNPNDLQPLTAGHFLIGENLRCINDQLVPTGSKLKMYTKLRAIKNEFWQRWSKEYLTELQYRHKWRKIHPQIKPGALVTIKEDNLPPLHWKMGRVVTVIPDDKGVSRVVLVKTAAGIAKRAIHEICPLPDVQHEIEPVKDKESGSDTELVQDTMIPAPTTTRYFLRSHDTPNAKDKHQKQRVPNTKNKGAPKTRRQPMRRPKDTRENVAQLQPRATRSGRQYGAVSLYTRGVMGTIAILALILGAFGSSCNVTTFDTQSGLYFEDIGQLSLTSNSWTLVSYLDMNAYWQQADDIEAMIDHMNTSCPPSYMVYCDKTIERFRFQFNAIDEDNKLLHLFSRAKVNRKKRGWFDAGGKAAKEIFGIMDEDDAKHYDHQIEQLKANEAHLMNLLRNQTTIQEITSNIIKRDEHVITEQLNAMKAEIENLHGKTPDEGLNIFNTISLQVLLSIGVYKDIQSTIVNLVTDVYHGMIPPIIITTDQLKTQLIGITNYIPATEMIPGDGNGNQISRLFYIMTAQVRLTDTKLIVKMVIPLISREYFKLYHIMRIPFVHKDSLQMVTTEQKYIGINLKQDHYYFLPPTDYEKCKAFDDAQIICTQHQPLYGLQQSKMPCELAVMLHQHQIHEKCKFIQTDKDLIWTKLSSKNQYLFHSTKPTDINMICNTKSSKTVEQCTIMGTGIVAIPNQCILKNGVMEISSHNAISTNISAIMIIPEVNMSDILSKHGINSIKTSPTFEHWNPFQKDTQLNALEHAIRLQKENEHFTDNKQLIIHQTTTYILITIVIIAMLCYVFRNQLRRLCHNQRTWEPNGTEIEMKQMHQSADVEQNSVERESEGGIYATPSNRREIQPIRF